MASASSVAGEVPADDDTEGEGAEAEGREEESRLPKQNIMRIMKKELPERSKIARDATSAMTEFLNEFICFVFAEANDLAQQQGSRVVKMEHVIEAAQDLGFDDYVGVLKEMMTEDGE
ncbi:hypothetical protein EMIHUDRAFT_256109, partial [Emiliania huxleyi CCMP1516]|uniref:Transcription factor CBF/NF-Y/archaeal histone domain-containing protein n=2 Tax=Emiliania huxleyi TaxID=2903 RepID=A0A0D3IZG9_EMIH1